MQNIILVLVNPLANKKKVNKINAEISKALSQKNILYRSFSDNWPVEMNEYKEVWIIGGDGTLNYFLNFYDVVEIPVVVFKGGTGNDFATRLYGKISVDEQIKKALVAEIRKVDAGECNGRKFINGVGIGFDGEVLKSMNAIRLLGGHLGYLWIVIRKIFSFREGLFTITYDNKSLSDKFLLVMITNSTTTGGGFKVSPEAKIDDGKLNMILCKPLSVFKRLQNLPVIEKGKHLYKRFIFHEVVDNIKVDCEKDTPAQIDGELISARSFDIKVLPEKYLFKY